MSGPIANDPLNPNTGDVGVPVESDLGEYVNTAAFDQQCSEKARELAATFSDESSDSDEDSFWSSDDSVSTATTVESTPYEIPKIEANLYYAGIGAKGRGPKLIYRTSDDKFKEPSGPEAYRRLMRFATKLSSYSTKEIEEDEDEEEDEEDDKEEEEVAYDDIPLIQPVEDGERYYTNPTIWIGVLPETLSGAIAHESSKDIRAFLDSLEVQNIDIAYRESLYKALPGHGPALFAPVEDGDALKEVTDNVSVPLSLPIAGRRTTMQGTLGPYFRVGNTLYAITVRHNLFLLNGDNEPYHYHESAQKKEVLVIDPSAFTNYLASIQALIGTHLDSVESLEKKIKTLRTRVEDGINVQESQIKLDQNEAELVKTRSKIDDLKKFFVNIKKRWSKPKDRVIGFVRWAPSIGVGVAPHRYTCDLCVIELYKDKFNKMIGNVLSLGPELSPSKLKALMYIPSEFKYPENGLLTLRGMLTADQVNNPNRLNLQGDRIRRVLKRGFTTGTTVGTLTRFMSFVRQYFPTGNLESLEVAILSHENDSGTFSKGGDSGSLIVSAVGEYVALLTGGTNKGTDGSDITFATLFEWVWHLVKEEFPGANLYFDNLQGFLADVA
ncbi:unnamed protein product [Somion occarium]|uniref:Uncharacterized protein n=1 Tax=Somion occarium TaxID=3059160 RepID=A0ABP1DZQ0_9APHY